MEAGEEKTSSRGGSWLLYTLSSPSLSPPSGQRNHTIGVNHGFIAMLRSEKFIYEQWVVRHHWGNLFLKRQSANHKPPLLTIPYWDILSCKKSHTFFMWVIKIFRKERRGIVQTRWITLRFEKSFLKKGLYATFCEILTQLSGNHMRLALTIRLLGSFFHAKVTWFFVWVKVFRAQGIVFRRNKSF